MGNSGVGWGREGKARAGSVPPNFQSGQGVLCFQPGSPGPLCTLCRFVLHTGSWLGDAGHPLDFVAFSSFVPHHNPLRQMPIR